MTRDRNRARGSLAEAAAYAASSIFALTAAAWASIPIYREWGRIAAGPYAAGALLAWAIAARALTLRARIWVAVAVLSGAALLPLGLEVAWRARTAPGLHAQAEAIITEEAAKALVHGHDPYAATYLHGPLAGRPLGTKTHFPYLPGMLAFGLPRALGGDRPLTDSRVWFALGTFVATGVALAASRWREEARLRAFLVLAVLPSGALLMATGGDDVPVLALLLVALVLAGRQRPVGAGVALGLALAAKQTAWILVPFLVVAVGLAQGRRSAAKLAATAGAVAVPLIGAFVAWDPAAFWEDTVRFPLGLGRQQTSAATPTLGSVLVHAFPDAKTALTIVFVALGAALVAFLLLRRPPTSTSGAALGAALVFAFVFVLAPAARFGYVVYPIDLAVWGWVLARPDVPSPGPAGSLRP